MKWPLKLSIWNRCSVSEGINVDPADEQDDDSVQPEPAINHAPKAAIELRVVGGSTRTALW